MCPLSTKTSILFLAAAHRLLLSHAPVKHDVSRASGEAAPCLDAPPGPHYNQPHRGRSCSEKEEGLNIALREEMTPGDTLQEKLTWLERVGIEGIELSGKSLDLPPKELELSSRTPL